LGEFVAYAKKIIAMFLKFLEGLRKNAHLLRKVLSNVERARDVV